MTLDHSTDATSRDQAKERDEAQQREIERLRGEVAGYRGRWLTACVLLTASILIFGWDSGVRLPDAIDARDAAQAQAVLYLDGWRQCVRDRDSAVYTVPPGTGTLFDTTDMPSLSLLSVRDANGTQIGYVDLHGVCHGKLTKAQCEQGRALCDRGSLLDPTRRIDR